MRSAPMLDFPLDEFEQRLGKLFDTLERTDCAAVLLTNVENLRYYCNFRTSAWNSESLSPAMLVVARGGGIALVTSPPHEGHGPGHLLPRRGRHSYLRRLR